jgi:hypothetical protein
VGDHREYLALVVDRWWFLVITVAAAGCDAALRIWGRVEAAFPRDLAIAVAIVGIVLAQYFAFREMQRQRNALRGAGAAPTQGVTVSGANQQSRSGTNLQIFGGNNTISIGQTESASFDTNVGDTDPGAKK